MDTVAHLAEVIWTEHYPPIIGQAQVDHMLRTVHSREAIEAEVESKGYEYFLILSGREPVGYISVQKRDNSLFLSKIYLLSRERGSGFGRRAIEFVRELALSQGVNKISLTVNKDNAGSISAYEKMGFAITGDICIDIGEGFVMDDYVMEMGI